jgi:5'-phosphate synthase pdxT subunit
VTGSEGAGEARDAPVVGVLALQGDFEAHAAMLRKVGADPREVRTVEQLQGLDGLVIPGGESTTITLAIEREQMAGPLRDLAASGMPILGTCAGMIMLDREHLGLMDAHAERNAFGRQVRSFEAELDVDGIDGGPVRAVFIRAPRLTDHGPDVQILAEVDGHPVAARQGNLLTVAFHPELTDDTRVHEAFLNMVRRR